MVGIDNLNDYYDIGLKNGRERSVERPFPVVCIRKDFHSRLSVPRDAVPGAWVRIRGESRGTGGRALQSHQSPGHTVKAISLGISEHSRSCRRNGVLHLVYASSSSVYGLNASVPFSVHHYVTTRFRFTRRRRSRMSFWLIVTPSGRHSDDGFTVLYGVRTVGASGHGIFHVYQGDTGRPSIDVFNNGDMERDFTYIDDIVEVCAE